MKQQFENGFVSTHVFQRIKHFAEMICMGQKIGWLYGPSGIGKTYALRELEGDTRLGDPALLRIGVECGGPTPLVRAALDLYGIAESGDAASDLTSLENHLQATQRMLLIDEAARLKLSALKLLFKLHRKVRCPILMVAISELKSSPRKNFMQYEMDDCFQGTAKICMFSRDDVEMMVHAARLELGVDSDVVDVLTQFANNPKTGRLHKVIPFLRLAHKFAKDSGSGSVADVHLQSAIRECGF